MPADFHRELREGLRAFLDQYSPSVVVRDTMDSVDGFDRTLWERMAQELGLHGIAVPEEYGGAGGTLSDIVVVHEELGRALVCAPFFSTIALAARAVQHSDDRDAEARYLPGFADGTSVGTVVLNGTLGPWSSDTVTLRATREGEHYSIDGSAHLVLDGHVADVVIVAALDDKGVSMYVISGDAIGLEREVLAGLDRTRKIASLNFNSVAATLIGRKGAADPAFAAVADEAIIALAAEQLGGASLCLDMAVDYAKQRIQFGRAIGSFQAVKHRCADLLVDVESARSAVEHAAAVAERNGDDRSIVASVAKMTCSDAFSHAAVDNMKIHGGIGFTWEHDAHLYVRRAKASHLLFGDPDAHAERLASLMA